MRTKLLFFGTGLILFILPFFWLKPGQIDIGGDSTRLYFYDPYHYFTSTLRYVLLPVGIGSEENYFMFLPFVLFLGFFRFFLSPYILISAFNGIQLITAFFSVFFIIKELLESKKKQSDFIPFLAGFMYIFSPVLIRSAWDKAIVTHEQFFLNPLIFYLLLKFFKTNNFLYLLYTLLLSVLFSANFSAGGAPPFFAFFPLSIVFLLCYEFFVLRKKPPIKQLLVGFVLFIFLEFFHLLPTLLALFDNSGSAFARAFTTQGQLDAGLQYFLVSATNITIRDNLLNIPQLVPSIIPYQFLFLIIPFLFVIGLYKNIFSTGRVKMTFLLLFIFFLISFFLDTANVTNIGFDIYKSLFRIPGFSMFRNFYGQWAFLYIFFFTLLLSYSLYYLSFSLTKKYFYLLASFLLLLYIISALPFIRGDLINPVLNNGSNSPHRIAQFFDPSFEAMLSYIRDKKLVGTYFSFPFTESFYELVSGTDGGVYIGPSMISHLTGNYDIPGSQTMEPLGSVFLKMAKEKNYEGIEKLFGILNITYVYYNSDKRILKDFPGTPYAYVKDSLPDTQKDYQTFIKRLPVNKIVSFGKYYSLYHVSNDAYLPKVYIANEIVNDPSKMFSADKVSGLITNLPKKGVIISTNHNYSTLSSPSITVERINPTKFYIHVAEDDKPYFLVFSQAYNKSWKLYMDISGRSVSSSIQDIFFNADSFETFGKKSIADATHQQVNYYANGWYITPRDTMQKHEYTLILEMASQKYYYIALIISGLAFLGVLIFTFYEKTKSN